MSFQIPPLTYIQALRDLLSGIWYFDESVFLSIIKSLNLVGNSIMGDAETYYGVLYANSSRNIYSGLDPATRWMTLTGNFATSYPYKLAVSSSDSSGDLSIDTSESTYITIDFPTEGDFMFGWTVYGEFSSFPASFAKACMICDATFYNGVSLEYNPQSGFISLASSTEKSSSVNFHEFVYGIGAGDEFRIYGNIVNYLDQLQGGDQPSLSSATVIINVLELTKFYTS